MKHGNDPKSVQQRNIHTVSQETEGTVGNYDMQVKQTVYQESERSPRNGRFTEESSMIDQPKAEHK